jgi:predicted signal transduction protein with EAL and GGDEF domain
MTNFVVYMIGMLLVVGALAYGASLLGISPTWITVGVIALLGIGIMGGIVKTRHRDPAS